MPSNPIDIAKPIKRVALALQGGGSHGGFTWGVLDRLLQEDTLSIEAISGTSAGAMNAAALAYGLMTDGPEGARKALHDFWRNVARTGESIFNPYYYLDSQFLRGRPRDPWPVSAWLTMMSLVWSPYNNPFYTNALAGILTGVIDFERLRACQKPKLFICATNVKTNKRKVFHTEEISQEVLLASACLPSVFRAVEVDGEAYWDGGYMGNPVLSPLLRHSTDVVIVDVSPMRRPAVPTSARDIADRLNEITFNSSLIHEINTVNTITTLIENGDLASTTYRPIHFHHISAEQEMSLLGAGSKSDTSWAFLVALRDLGIKTAEEWLRDPNQFGKVGMESSVDVANELLAALY
jgi:NTE family protein